MDELHVSFPDHWVERAAILTAHALEAGTTKGTTDK